MSLAKLHTVPDGCFGYLLTACRIGHSEHGPKQRSSRASRSENALGAVEGPQTYLMDYEADSMMVNGNVIQSNETKVDTKRLIIDQRSSHPLEPDISVQSSPSLFVTPPPPASRVLRPRSASTIGSDANVADSLAPTDFVQVLIPKTKSAALPYSSSQSGLVYDSLMRRHAEPIHYDSDGEEIVEPELHPEDPRRIKVIFDILMEAGLVADLPSSEQSEYQLRRIPTRHATRAEICTVHTEDHFRWVESLAGESWFDTSILSNTEMQANHRLNSARLVPMKTRYTATN